MQLGLYTNISENRLNIFPEMLKKCLTVPEMFLNIPKNPLVFLFFKQGLKRMSEIVYTSILEIEQLSKQHGGQGGNRWTGLFLA